MILELQTWGGGRCHRVLHLTLLFLLCLTLVAWIWLRPAPQLPT